MSYKTFTLALVIFTAILGFLTTPSTAYAAQETVLYSFCSLPHCADGQFPVAGLVMDKAGNLYGVTPEGGEFNAGVVFELIHTGSGWQEKVLHTFGSVLTSDGNGPSGPLVMDDEGNLYGATTSGGAFNNGIVFELVPTNGVWIEKILCSFDQNGLNGNGTKSGLVRDSQGHLYGTAFWGGFGCGTVFEVAQAQNGQWAARTILAFDIDQSKGANPAAGLTLDKLGNLYGTTENGGRAGVGVVFELLRSSAWTGWNEKVLYNFGSIQYDGNNPVTGVIFDKAGNLYGTTGTGAYSFGSVFELIPEKNGQWTEKQICPGSCYGPGPLTFDNAGNLYSTFPIGGTYNYGSVFELSPTGNGSWEETVLNNFDVTDGSIPTGNLVVDASGNIYGVTSAGGEHDGVVYEITR